MGHPLSLTATADAPAITARQGNSLQGVTDMSSEYPTLTDEQVALSVYATAQARKDNNDTPSTPGECAAFQRVVCTRVLGILRAWAPGPDAISVGRILRERGQQVTDGKGAQVGDLLVWSVGHGPHGHIAMRVIGNRVAENSSAHIDGNDDARGFRNLADLDQNYTAYRLWR